MNRLISIVLILSTASCATIKKIGWREPVSCAMSIASGLTQDVATVFANGEGEKLSSAEKKAIADLAVVHGTTRVGCAIAYLAKAVGFRSTDSKLSDDVAKIANRAQMALDELEIVVE